MLKRVLWDLNIDQCFVYKIQVGKFWLVFYVAWIICIKAVVHTTTQGNLFWLLINCLNLIKEPIQKQLLTDGLLQNSFFKKIRIFSQKRQAELKGTLTQMWKSVNIFFFIWKWYVIDFSIKLLLVFEICAREIREKFAYKHSETIEYVKN